MTGEHVGHPPVVRGYLDHCVRRGDRGIDGGIGLQGIHVCGDDRLRHQGSDGVMQQHVALFFPQRGERCGRRVVPGIGSLQNLAHLGVFAAPDDFPDFIEVSGRHHHDNLVDQRRLLHGGDRVLDDRLARDLDQLLRNAETDPGPGAAGKHHRHVPQSHCRSLPSHALGCRPTAGGRGRTRVFLGHGDSGKRRRTTRPTQPRHRARLRSASRFPAPRSAWQSSPAVSGS